MALINGSPNELNFYGLRKVHIMPPHFITFTINKYNQPLIRNINNWIFKYLNGRYCICQDISLDKDNTIVYNTRIGFEVEEELTFFILVCPYL